MKLTLLSFFASLYFLTATSQEKEVNVESKIKQVTVFLSGAQIQRTASVEISAGVSRIVFSGLSPDIETQSIQAKGVGAFTVLSVNKQANFLEEQKANEELKKWQSKIDDQKEQIEIERNQIAVLKSEEEMLGKNQEVSSGTSGTDLNKLKLALDFQRSRLTEAKNKQLTITKRIKTLEEDLAKLTKQVAEIQGKSRMNTSDIVIKVSSKNPTKGNITLTYLVKNASWYPTYDLRALDVASPIDLIYKANVVQNSGEDWNHVKLILSSGNPSEGGNKPELKPYNIGYYNVSDLSGFKYGAIQANIRSVKGRVFAKDDGQPVIGCSIKVKGTSIGTVSDPDGNYSLQIPANAQSLVVTYIGYETQEIAIRSNQIDVMINPSSQTLSEVVVTGYSSVSGDNDGGSPGAAKSVKIRGISSIPIEVESTQSQTSLQFEIQNPYTILSDGKQFTVDIAQHEIPALYEYYSAPKLSPDVFLTASITSITDLNLLSGEASIFFEGTYLGKTLIDVQNSNDTLNVSLGIDKNVVIKRDREKGFSEKQFLGSSIRATRGFTIDIKNRKSQPINLVVEDQVPLSNNSDISIDRQEISNAKVDESSGKLTWKLMLKPNEQQKLHLKYQVKYPKSRTLNLE